MIVSLEDAVSLLSKWEADETPVSALILADGFWFSLAGFITVRSPSFVNIVHLTPQAQKLGEFEIALPSVVRFVYRDVREAKESIRERIEGHIASSLMMQLPQAECTIYELVP